MHAKERGCKPRNFGFAICRVLSEQAMSAACMRREIPNQHYRPVAPAWTAWIAGALLIAFNPAPAKADDVDRQHPVTRLAAVEADKLKDHGARQALPLPGNEIDAGFAMLFAQNSYTVAPGGLSREILVALVSTTPEGVDDDIAKQHGLELLDRTELTSQGLRIVRYRAPDNRPIAPIIAELATDPRIRRAQINAQYGLPVPGSASTEVGGLKSARPKAARVGGKVPPAVPRRVVGSVDAGQPRKDRAASAAAYRPLPAGKVADVLSGGL